MPARLDRGPVAVSEPAEMSTRAELGALVRLAAPIALSQLAVMAMSLVDTAVLGRGSVDDLAAAAMGRSIVFAASAPAFGIGIATEPLAAQAVGAGEHGRAWAALIAANKASAVATLAGLPLALGLVAALPLLGVDAHLVPSTFAFVLGQLPGIGAFGGYLATRSFLQAYGRTTPILFAAVIANVVNAIACSVLVLGDRALGWVGLGGTGFEGLGALGAGLSASIGTSVLLGVMLLAARGLRPKIPDPPLPARTVLRLGLPIGMQLLAEIGVFSLAALVAGRLGSTVVSAHQVAVGLASFTFMGAIGVSGATATRVGHAVGAGRSALVPGLLGIGLGALVMVVGAVAFTVFPESLVRLFTADPAVVALGVQLLGIAAIFQLFDGVQAVASGALRGAGDVRFPFLANVGAHWLVGLPTSLLFGFVLGLGARGIWYGLTLGLVIVSILLAGRFAWIGRRPIARV